MSAPAALLFPVLRPRDEVVLTVVRAIGASCEITAERRPDGWCLGYTWLGPASGEDESLWWDLIRPRGLQELAQFLEIPFGRIEEHLAECCRPPREEVK